jgi:hypothetical protein
MITALIASVAVAGLVTWYAATHSAAPIHPLNSLSLDIN